MRRVENDDGFALLLGKLRALARSANWFQAPKDDAPRLRVREIAAIEKELAIELPDPVLAYIAAGVSAWGDGPLRLGAITEQTLMLREVVADFDGGRGLDDFAVIDDDSNGNYIAVERGTRKDSDCVFFLDHEGMYASKYLTTLSEAVERRCGERDIAASKFVVELVDEPEAIQAVRHVRHPKFGAGRVLAEDGDTVTVMFELVGSKRMKRTFLVFD